LKFSDDEGTCADAMLVSGVRPVGSMRRAFTCAEA
jgi:hypothetical protein